MVLMQFFGSSVVLGLSASLAPIASAYPNPLSSADSLSVSTVGTVPEVSSLENLVVRHNGDVLVTSLSNNTLHAISPSKNTTARDLVTIPGVTALSGIVELERDVFYVAATNSSVAVTAPGSNSVWKVDMRNSTTAPNGCTIDYIQLSQVADLPSVSLINGVSRLAQNDTSHLLFSDSTGGTVSILDVQTGRSEVVMQDPIMATLPGGLGIGVNGIKTFGDHLFFNSLDQHVFASVPISLSSGQATGPIVPVVHVNGTADDFTLSRDGSTAFIAFNGNFAMLKVDIATGNSQYIPNPLLNSISSVALSGTQDAAGFEPMYITGAVAVDNSTTIGGLFRADPS